MKKNKMGCIVGAGGLILIIVGFITLLRGCLSAYDERSKVSQALIFAQGGKPTVFTLVKYDKCTSYRQSGGFVSKSVSTTYYLQLNDAATGEVMKEQELIDHSDVKNYPVEIIGESGGKAWLFVNELLAYDPATLEKKADIAILESKNPSLKGKFPATREFYRLDARGRIFVTAKDGLEYTLDATSLIAKPYDENDEPEKKNLARLKIKKKKTDDEKDSLYLVWRKASYGNGRTDKEYKAWYRADSLSSVLYDSLNNAESLARDFKSRIRDYESKLSSEYNFYNSVTNADTSAGTIYTLLSQEEFDRMSNGYFYFSHPSGNSERRKLYTVKIDKTKRVSAFSSSLPVAGNPEPVANSPVFIQGGILMPKTGTEAMKTGNGFLVMSRDQIGNEGKLVLSRMTYEGKQLWSLPLPVNESTDIVSSGNTMVIFARDNSELSSGDSNLLISIDLNTGKAVYYDYMLKSIRGAEAKSK